MFRTLFVSSATLLLCLPAMAEDHPALKFGAPDTGRIIDRGKYVLSYDGRLRSARWVAERLTKESLEDTEGVVRGNDFLEESNAPDEFRATNADYKNSGFDRGHLAPAADYRLTQEDNDNSFYLSNMSPQEGPNFNQHYWKYLEIAIRKLAEQDDVEEVYVFTGPLFMPANAPKPEKKMKHPLVVSYMLIGNNHVPVPTHYFKAVLAVATDDSKTIWAFILPNDKIATKTPIKRFAVPTDYLEHWAGLDLWSELDDSEEMDLEETTAEPWVETLPTKE